MIARSDFRENPPSLRCIGRALVLPVRVKSPKRGERRGKQQGCSKERRGELGLELHHLLQLRGQGGELVVLIGHCGGTAGSSVLRPRSDSKGLGDGDVHIRGDRSPLHWDRVGWCYESGGCCSGQGESRGKQWASSEESPTHWHDSGQT